MHESSSSIECQIKARWEVTKITVGSRETRLLGKACKCLSRNSTQVNDLNEVARSTSVWHLLSLRACSHDPGTTHCPGQLTDPRVNFASVHGLTPVTVHTSFSLPRGNSETRVTRCTTPGNPPRRGNFSSCEQSAKVAPGQE